MADMLVRTRIGPADHGRPMALEEFAVADGEPGYLYELARGVINVVDLPGLPHGRVVKAIDRQITFYEAAHPGLIYYWGGGSEAGMQLYGMQSERHPDISIYLTRPSNVEAPWDQWVPDIVIEVVSASSRSRDYREKREEYLEAGLREYWIVDRERETMLALRRAGDVWRELRVPAEGEYQTPLLPGFSLDLAAVFRAAEV